MAVGAPCEIVVATTVASRAPWPHNTLILQLFRLLGDLFLPVVSPALGVRQHALELFVFRLVDGTAGHLPEPHLQRGDLRGISVLQALQLVVDNARPLLLLDNQLCQIFTFLKVAMPQ